jgi:hypothetical protein
MATVAFLGALTLYLKVCTDSVTRVPVGLWVSGIGHVRRGRRSYPQPPGFRSDDCTVLEFSTVLVDGGETYCGLCR